MNTSPTAPSTQSPRLLLVASYLQGFGGVEQLLVDLATTARDGGWEVTVVAPRRLEPDGPLEAALTRSAWLVTAEGCWQHRPGARGLRFLAGARAAVVSRRLPDAARRSTLAGDRARPFLASFWSRPAGQQLLDHADVVHVVGSHPFGAHAIEAASAVGMAVGYSETTTPTAHGAADPYHAPFRRALGGIHTVVTHSERVAVDFRSAYGYRGPSIVVDQWLSADVESALLGLPLAPASSVGAPLVVGSLSRLARGKGLETLVDATALAAAAGIAVILVLGGDGPERAALVDRAANRGVAYAVRLPGLVPAAERAAFLGALDVFAMASRGETGPYSGLEAMAAGRALVTTPVGAMPDRLRGDEARFVEVGDVDAWAEALMALAQERDVVGRLGRRARAAFVRGRASIRPQDRMLELWEVLACDRIDRIVPPEARSAP